MTHRFRQRLLLALLAAGIVTGSKILAADAAHPVVPGFERFYTGAQVDPARGGQLLLGELNCVSCHQLATKASSRKEAPILDHVAGRVRVSYLRKFLSDPQAAKPGSPMPNLFAGDPEREQKVEALVHYLASTFISSSGSSTSEDAGETPALPAIQAAWPFRWHSWSGFAGG